MRDFIVPIVLIFVVFVVAPVLVWKCMKDTSNNNEAYRLVNEWAEKLDESVGEDGLYKHYSGELPLDPYGNKLHIHYRKTNHTETLTVRSAGPDGVMFSRDDMVEKRTRFHSLGNHLKDAARGLRK